MAWRMPVETGRSAKPIHIFAGENFASQIDTEQQIKDIWAIDGNFKVYLDHYLYIDSQLIIRKAITEEISQVQQDIEVIDDENGIQIAKVESVLDGAEHSEMANMVTNKTVIKEVLFDQNRRLRSEEIHYLDHPLMGIIVQIRKIAEKD
jgi:hypothetical protein